MVVPLLVEVEDDFAVCAAVKRHERDDEEREGRQIEHGQARVALESIAGQHYLHAEVETEQGDQRAKDGGDDYGVGWLILIGKLWRHDFRANFRRHSIHIVVALAVLMVLILAFVFFIVYNVFDPSHNGPVWSEPAHSSCLLLIARALGLVKGGVLLR